MSTKQNNLFYYTLIAISVVITLWVLYTYGLDDTMVLNERRSRAFIDVYDPAKTFHPISLLSLIPMAITVKIYNDIRKLLSAQEYILAELNKTDAFITQQGEN